MTDWFDPFDNGPDWKDEGKTVEVELNDGILLSGTLEIYDMTPGPDEIPLFRVKTDSSELRWFDDIRRYRFA